MTSGHAHSQAWAELYQKYLFYVTAVYGKDGFQGTTVGAGALKGPLLSPNAGGFIAKRSVYDWLYGGASRLHRHTVPHPHVIHWRAPVCTRDVIFAGVSLHAHTLRAAVCRCCLPRVTVVVILTALST